MPKLWNETIEAHRHAVRAATLDAAAALVAEHGLTSVTMSRIAERTGIGRATLYKYFPDVEAILSAWHERQIAAHLDELGAARDRTGDAGERLDAVLRAYALIQHQRGRHHRYGPSAELVSLLHPDEHVVRAQHRLRDLFHGLLVDAAALGAIRDDVPAHELASYCLHALTAAAALPTEAAANRLAEVTLAGLRPRG